MSETKLLCELCTMEYTHTFIDADGLVHRYCEHHAPKGSIKRGDVRKTPWYKTYMPLLVAVGVVFLYVIARTIWGGTRTIEGIIGDVMGGYFIVFGVLQLMGKKGFAESFAKYDPIAKKYPSYGSSYPYLLLFFGFMHHIHSLMIPIAVITVVIFTIQTKGIIDVLRRGESVLCACVGTKFTLPLSYVTVFENVVMIVLAIASLLFSMLG